jgi:hypothetical protein
MPLFHQPRSLPVACAIVLLSALVVHPGVPAAEPPASEASDPGKILVEIFLAGDRKEEVNAITREFGAVGITKVHPKFFQLGNPPMNIAIGRRISADIARLAIRLAKTHNGGITKLLPEERLAPDYIAIGTSIFDESFQYPVSQEDVDRLADPALTTAQFHELYRKLADINRRAYR